MQSTEIWDMSSAVSDNHLERRKRYRVTDITRYGLSAAVLVDDATIPVEIYDVAFAGADVASRRLNLKVDQPVTLQFMAKGMSSPAVVQAIVRWRRHWDPDKTIRYGLLFQNPNRLPRQIPTKLLGAFNRRRSFRVAPRGEAASAKITRKDGFEFTLPIISLSATGAGCLARGQNEQMLMTGDVITIEFSVPEAKTPCSIVATVRYAIKQRGGIRYGVDFNEEQTPLFTRHQRAITRYVMEEQRRMLKPI